MRYSRFVNFSIKARAIFINEFAKHKHLFPGIDGEAFFVGTVLHSLDHTLMEWNLVVSCELVLWKTSHSCTSTKDSVGRIILSTRVYTRRPQGLIRILPTIWILASSNT